MAQSKAAAQRKIGLTARIYYAGFGLIAILWLVGFSFGHIFTDLHAVYERGAHFNLSGRIDLQILFLTLAAISGTWFALIGSKYSIIKSPRYFPKLKAVTILLLVAYFLCLIDSEDIIKPDVPIIMFILIPFWGLIVLEHIHKKLDFPLDKVSPFLWSLLIVILFISAPFADLSVDYQTVLNVFIAVGAPFLIFTIPIYYKLGLEYVKEHPEYRKMFIFGRGGAARWSGLYSFLKYDFNAFMNRQEIKHAPIYCGGSIWYDDVKLVVVILVWIAIP